MLHRLNLAISCSLALLFVVWGQFSAAGPNEYFEFKPSEKVTCTDFINPQIKNLALNQADIRDVISTSSVEIGVFCFSANNLINGGKYPIVISYIFGAKQYQQPNYVEGLWPSKAEMSKSLKINYEWHMNKLDEAFGEFACKKLLKNECFEYDDGDKPCSSVSGKSCLSIFPASEEIDLKFPEKDVHSLDEIMDYVKDLKKKSEIDLVKSIQRSIRNNFEWDTLNIQMNSEEMVIDGDPGDYTKRALDAVFKLKIDDYKPTKIPSDVIKEVLFGEIFVFGKHSNSKQPK